MSAAPTPDSTPRAAPRRLLRRLLRLMFGTVTTLLRLSVYAVGAVGRLLASTARRVAGGQRYIADIETTNAVIVDTVQQLKAEIRARDDEIARLLAERGATSPDRQVGDP